MQIVKRMMQIMRRCKKTRFTSFSIAVERLLGAGPRRFCPLILRFILFLQQKTQSSRKNRGFPSAIFAGLSKKSDFFDSPLCFTDAYESFSG